jgi:nondiscriminating glutamyl-tRNA synthetase
MLGKDKKKLSKRSGDTSLEDYRIKGYPREAIANFLCLQGWALDGAREIFSIDELVRNFDIRSVNKAGAVFDPEKFLWMSGEYIRMDTVERVAERCAPFVIDAGICSREELERRRAWYEAVVAQEKERTGSTRAPQIAHYFASDEDVRYEPDVEASVRKREDRVAVLTQYAGWLAERESNEEPASLSAATKSWLSERGLKVPALFQPLRLALTGMGGGADLFEIMRLLGRDRVLARIHAGVRRLV